MNRYLYVDFAVVSALQRYLDLDLIVACYDIICQYIINFRKRMTTEFTDEMIEELASIVSAELPKIHPGVGKYHLPMHTKDCQKKFSLHLLPCACMDDGEWNERDWGITEGWSRRVKEMSVGHREDTMHDMSDDQNVLRVHGMGMCAYTSDTYHIIDIEPVSTLMRKHDRGLKRLDDVTEYLDTVEASIATNRDDGETLLAEWRSHEAQWKKIVVDISQHHKIDSDYPYEPPADAGIVDPCQSGTS